MYTTDIVGDIYNGNLEVIQKTLSDTKDVHIYSINNLMRAGQNEDYRISLVTLVFKGEADHPGQFLKYKKIVDLLISKYGIGYLMYNVEHPEFFKYDKSSNQMSYIQDKNLVSKQMRTYLRHVQVRDEAQRKETSTLLHDIDEKAKSEETGIKSAVQIVKRQIVSNYRLLYPKTNER